MDTWRAAYGGIVPDDYLEGLSYDGLERLWRDRPDANPNTSPPASATKRQPSGFASGRPRRRFSEGLAEYGGVLETLYVLPAYQGKSAGGRLVGAVARCLSEQGVASMLLWVLADNRRARGFYESLGGVPIAEDTLELGGARLFEVAYGWRDLDAPRARTAGA